MSGTDHLVVHAHCYQPPREDPWLELVPTEPTAAPDHDWNARITRECYAPLGAAPVLDGDGSIVRVLNCWEYLTFDVGATLARWLERHAPPVLEAMVSGDRAAIARTGYGNAIAAPFHHVILPLASRRDKVTEVRWGVREFRRVFGREPLGMWLPETAMDEETLEVLLDEGIRYTILAPHQVDFPDPAGRPLAWRRGDRTLTLVTYDGALSHGVAFGELLKDGNRFAEAVQAMTGHRGPGTGDHDNPPITGSSSPVSVIIATDGETYGHHHRFGDLALAVMLDRVRRVPGIAIVGSDALAMTSEPAGDATVVAPTSWSCSHGVGRWQEECGCRMDSLTSQAWRAPLRAGLEVLARGVDAVVGREWPAGGGNWHDARDAAGPDLDGPDHQPVVIRRLLEAERQRLAMFTSCAWFFDDLARIEPRLALQHAARALDLIPADDREALETALLTALAMAESNDPADGNGAMLWRTTVAPGRLGVARLAAGVAALRDLAPDALDDLAVPAHDWSLAGDDVTIHHRRTGESTTWRSETVVLGVVAHRIHVHEYGDSGTGAVVAAVDLPRPVRELLRRIATPLVLEATIDPEAVNTLVSGAVDPVTIRSAALEGAIQIAGRDGLEVADVVIHAALDLFDLDGEAPSLLERSRTWQQLATMPGTAEARRLKERLGVAIDERR